MVMLLIVGFGMVSILNAYLKIRDMSNKAYQKMLATFAATDLMERALATSRTITEPDFYGKGKIDSVFTEGTLPSTPLVRKVYGDYMDGFYYVRKKISVGSTDVEGLKDSVEAPPAGCSVIYVSIVKASSTSFTDVRLKETRITYIKN